ncbi:MAG: DNA polymerase III subunit gamma/tau [bacterium]
MSQTLYRKYRPKAFGEVIGQEHVVKTLQNEIASGRVVHSYLFTGPRGIGKTTIARLLAKALNCATRQEASSEPCNECDNCRASALGNSLNIIEIDAASHTGVDNVRDKIIENTRFLPAGAKYKVFIIDEVHMLSAAAFNALLKTLEEPPSHIVFILATTELHKVPATIISRCQRFDFRKLTAKEIVGRLENLAGLESVKAEKNVLERIAHLAEGGLRDAEGLFGQLLGLGIKDIKEEDADLILPRSDMGAALAFLEFLISKNGREAMILTQNLNEKGIDFKYFFDNVIELARKLLYVKITGEIDAFLFDDVKKSLLKLAAGAPLVEISKLLDVLIARRSDVRLLDIPSLPLELAIAELCGDPSSPSLRAPFRQLADGRGNPDPSVIPAKAGIQAAPSAVATPAFIPASPSVIPAQAGISGDLPQIMEKWHEVLQKIQSYNHSLPFILKLSRPAAFDGKNLTLGIKYKLHKEKLEDPKNYSILTEVIKSVYNMEIIIIAEINAALDIEVPAGEEEIAAENAFV